MRDGIRALLSAALVAACGAAQAQPGVATQEHPKPQTTDSANMALRMAPLAPVHYDADASHDAAGFGYKPSATTFRLIDTNLFKLEWRSDGMGHGGFVAPGLKGAAVNGSGRNDGGVFKFSWPTTK